MSQSLNKVFVISAPSGTGKTTLLKAYAQQGGDHAVAVSHTTRAPRAGESNGMAYHFVDHAVFERLIESNQMLEYAHVFGNYYGTSKAAVDTLLDQGKQVILEIDWQGARQVRKLYGDRCVSIFIAPPSIQALRERLESRGLDSAETIELRMNQAEAEMSHANEYDHIVVNDDFEKALERLANILQ